ncbi:hypothetical protein [Rugosimonospora africana]|uniref:hypothetical protein n=1 Tax=Rugosimonospora africana TaxID=556532 RepID=UPI0019422515|nr:hypothetical protein [Rugosimonospora africana]
MTESESAEDGLTLSWRKARSRMRQVGRLSSRSCWRQVLDVRAATGNLVATLKPGVVQAG